MERLTSRRRQDPDRLRAQVAALLAHLGTLGAEGGRTVHHEESRRHLKIPCRRAGCLCTHDYPCEAGWMDAVIDGHDAVQPCPRCRPDVAAAVAQSGGRREILQSLIRDSSARERAEVALGETGWDD